MHRQDLSLQNLMNIQNYILRRKGLHPAITGNTSLKYHKICPMQHAIRCSLHPSRPPKQNCRIPNAIGTYLIVRGMPKICTMRSGSTLLPTQIITLCDMEHKNGEVTHSRKRHIITRVQPNITKMKYSRVCPLKYLCSIVEFNWNSKNFCSTKGTLNLPEYKTEVKILQYCFSSKINWGLKKSCNSWYSPLFTTIARKMVSETHIVET